MQTKYPNMKIRLFYIQQEIGEGIPDYNFIVKAIGSEEAHKIATKIIKTDYPDYGINYSCIPLSANKIIKLLTLN